MIGSGRIAPRQWRVTIEQLMTLDGPSGAPITQWMPLLTASMGREAMTGDERIIAGQLSASQYTRWTMPPDPTMDPDVIDVPATRRLQVGARVHDIVRARRIGDLGALLELVTLAASKV
jgi:hypothetical protein